MIYEKINQQTHILYSSIDRFRFEIEIILHCGGSVFEKEQNRGQKHLLEHCIASRTKNFNFQELKDFQFAQNISLNAYTGPVTMGLTATGHRNDLEKVLIVLWEMITNPTFEQSILEREKEIVLREISERRGDPAYELHYFIQNQVFTADSIEVHEVLGDADKVSLTTLDDFSTLHSQSLKDSQIIIQIAGSEIDITKIKEICKF